MIIPEIIWYISKISFKNKNPKIDPVTGTNKPKGVTFTELYLLCEKNGCSYNTVKEMMLKRPLSP